MPADSRGFGLLSHFHVSNLWLQMKELESWCRISSAGFSLLSKAVVWEMCGVLAQALCWDGGPAHMGQGMVLAPTSAAPGCWERAAPGSAPQELQHRAGAHWPGAMFLCSLAFPSSP